MGEDKIEWFSNIPCMAEYDQPALEKSKITWYSNDSYITYPIDMSLEEDKIAGFSNTIIGCLIWEMSFGGR